MDCKRDNKVDSYIHEAKENEKRARHGRRNWVICEAMNKDAPAGVIYKKNHLQNKIPTLSKDYCSNEFLLKKTGLGIHPSTGAFTGSTEVQKEIGETDSNALKFFKVPLLNYALLDELLRLVIMYSFSFLSIYFVSSHSFCHAYRFA